MKKSRATPAVAWSVGIAGLAAFPWWANNYYVHIVAIISVFIVVAVGMNILVGMAGLVSLGHAGLFALGAYTSALLGTRLGIDFWSSALAGIAVAAAVGAVLALAALRARGIYLAMVTIAFGIIVEQVALDQDEFTGGFMGVSGIPVPSIAGFDFTPPFRLYLVLALAGLSIWLARNLRHSRWGRGLLAVRENWVAAESLGVSRYRMETTAFVLSAAFTGLGGALFAQQNAYIAPNIFTFDLSVLMLLFVILGGLGTVWGPAVGVVVLLMLPEIMSDFADFRLIVYGAVMLACLYLMPQGIAGFFEKRRRAAPEGQDPEASSDALNFANAISLQHRRESDKKQPRESDKEPLVRIDGLSKVFGGLTAIENLDLSIRRQAIHSLIGPNGAGKTTLVNMLSGFYRPEEGDIHFDGRRVTGWSAHRMAKTGVARTFQATRLFPQLTVLENVMVGLHRHLRQDLGSALIRLPGIGVSERSAVAEARAALAFAGFPGDPSELASNLAFGHRRLAEIARALVSRPDLLLLDEPAAGLTAGEIEELDKLITRVRDLGVTVLLIEHHMDLVMEISDYVTVLDYGRKIAEGRPEEIQANPLVVEAYLGHDD